MFHTQPGGLFRGGWDTGKAFRGCGLFLSLDSLLVSPRGTQFHGQVPEISRIFDAAQGIVQLAGQTPEITRYVFPTAGSFALTGRAPEITRYVFPTAGSGALAGAVPVVVEA